MSKIIVEIRSGGVNEVYTDSHEQLEISILDHDEPDEETHFNLNQLIQKGLVKAVLNAEAKKILNKPTCPILDSNIFLVIRDENHAITPIGKKMQLLHAAFTDGYLSANAEISRFISQLFRSAIEEERQLASTIFNGLKPLSDMQSKHYNELCNFINQGVMFDQDTVAFAVEENRKTDYELLYKQLMQLVEDQKSMISEKFEIYEGIINYIEYELDLAEKEGLFEYPK